MAKTIFDKNPDKYIPALAEAIKKVPEFSVPEWAYFVKSGTAKQRPPFKDDFWFVRAASILRQLYIRGVVGVGRLRVKYGSKKDRGVVPDEFRKGSGKIIRLILQQAEKAGLVEKMSKLQFGRRLTQKGRDFLDSIEVEKKIGPDYASFKIKEMIATPEEEMGDGVNEEMKKEIGETEENGN